jgi:hypothetical protein
MDRKETPVVFPLLLAIYPILFLYAQNAQELRLQQAMPTAILASAVTALLFFTIASVIKNRSKAALFTVFLAYLFYFYPHTPVLSDLLKDLKFTDKGIAVSAALLAVLGYNFILNLKQETVQKLNEFLGNLAVLLIVFNLVRTAPIELKKAALIRRNSVETAVKIDSTGTDYPDIYYIILDEYASSHTIKQRYGYDNGPFETRLRGRGFYIAERSRSRYVDTYHSLATSLNMNYVDDHESPVNIYQMIQENRVANFLRQKGYSIVLVGGYHLPLDLGRAKTDIYLSPSANPRKETVDEFWKFVSSNSILEEIVPESMTYIENPRRRTIYVFDELKNLPGILSPKFVYAHVECPHAPFLFDENGQPTKYGRNSEDWGRPECYLAQYIYVSKQVSDTVERILDKSLKPPIIIIQSDHGPRLALHLKSQHPSVDTSYIPKEEPYEIFNAYHLPGFDISTLHENISPANSFRLIFNHYFGGEFKRLDD